MSASSKAPERYISVDDTNSYSKPKSSRNARRRALLWCAKLSCVPKGSGTSVSGRPMKGAIVSWFGRVGGILRIPSISSENAMRRVGMAPSVSASNARRTMVVRATSPKVPMWGSPEGP